MQTGPPALLCSPVRHLLLLRFIAARRAQAMSGWRRRRDSHPNSSQPLEISWTLSFTLQRT